MLRPIIGRVSARFPWECSGDFESGVARPKPRSRFADRKQPPFELGAVELPAPARAVPIITAHVLAADGYARRP